MGIFDMFTSKAAEPAVAPAAAIPVPASPPVIPGQPGNLPAPTVDTPVPVDGQGVVPVAPAPAPVIPGAPVPPVTEVPKDNSPLAEFSTLWDTDPKKKDEPNPAPTVLLAEDVQKVVDKIDFSQGIPPEVLTAVTAGGEDAQKAFTTAMNSMARQVMVQSTMVNNKLTENAIAKALELQASKIPEMLRSQAAAADARDSNPLFSNPAITPIIEATRSQLLTKFPEATPVQITKMTHDYVEAMGAAFAPKEVINNNSAQEMDWDAFMNADSP